MFSVFKSGMMQYIGMSMFLFTLLDKTVMTIMFIINYITLAHRFDYEKIPYGVIPQHKDRSHKRNHGKDKGNSDVKDDVDDDDDTDTVEIIKL